MWLLYDRLPLRRQEHVGQELPRARGNGWGRSHSVDYRDRLRAAARHVVEGSHRADRLTAPQAAHLHRHARRAGGWHLWHPEAAVQDARQRQAAQALGQAGRADPNQLGVDRRRGPLPGIARPRPHARRRDHLVDPSDLRHAHRAGSIRQGVQCDGSAADLDDRRGRAPGQRRSAVEAVLATGRARILEACSGCSTLGGGASAR